MDEQTIAERVRLFFRSLFGSRLVATLELRHLELRQDYERQLADKDNLIDSLRSDLASLRMKMETYETVILPIVSPVGNLFKPKPDPKTFERLSGPEVGSWAWVQQEWAKKQAEEAAAEAAAKETNGVQV